VGFFTAVKRWIGARPYLRELRARPELGFSVLFDAAYYRINFHGYRGRWPPLLHFIVAGAFEGRDPHPLFDTAFYLRNNPDLAANSVNPLFHYLLHGAAEGRKPHPLFEPAYYAAQLPVARGNHLLEYLKTGRESHAQPHPLFDGRGHLSAHAESGGRGANPLVEFVLHGAGPVTEGSQFGQSSLAPGGD
jgi:hypothetical protein